MDFLTEWGQIAGIAGMGLTIFLVLFREIIRKNIFPKLTKKQSFIIIMSCMAIVAFIAVFSIVKYYSGHSGGVDQVTVLVHGEKGRDDLVLPNRGKVKLLLGDAILEEVVNSKGEATFKQIPSAFFEKGVVVEVQFLDPGGEPYKAKSPDSLYTLTRGKYIALVVKLYGLTTVRGIVKDAVTGYPIDSVRISIRGLETFSNRYGEYRLELPPEDQRKFQTIRAFKAGYSFFELTEVPLQTGREVPVLMKKDPNYKRDGN